MKFVSVQNNSFTGPPMNGWAMPVKVDKMPADCRLAPGLANSLKKYIATSRGVLLTTSSKV